MTDPLIETPEFREAVKLAQVASRVEDFSLTQAEVEEILLAALPALRRALAEELRKEAERRDEESNGGDCSDAGSAWCDAADHLVREGT